MKTLLLLLFYFDYGVGSLILTVTAASPSVENYQRINQIFLLMLSLKTVSECRSAGHIIYPLSLYIGVYIWINLSKILSYLFIQTIKILLVKQVINFLFEKILLGRISSLRKLVLACRPLSNKYVSYMQAPSESML